MRLLLFSVLLLFPFFINAQFKYDWIRETGLSGITNNGDVYHTGHYASPIDLIDGVLSAGPGYTSDGQLDLIVAKYDSTGRFLWYKTVHSAGNEQVTYSTVTDNNHIILCGKFSNSVNLSFDSLNPAILTAAGNGFFFAAYDTAMNLLTAIADAEQNTFNIEKVLDAGPSASDGFYIMGEFWATTDFDLGSGNSPLTPMDNNIFIAHYSQSGNLNWVNQWGNDAYYNLKDAEADSAGRVFACGILGTPNFSGQDTFYLGLDTFMLNAITNYGFAVACDNSGNIIQSWLTENSQALGVAFGDDGNVYVGGMFVDSFDVNNDGFADFYAAFGAEYGFVVKLDSVMSYIDATQLTTMAGSAYRSTENSHYNGYIVIGGACATPTGNYIGFAWLDQNLDTVQTKTYYYSWASDVQKMKCSRSGELYYSGGFSSPITYESGVLPLTGTSGACKITPYCYPAQVNAISEDTVHMCTWLLNANTTWIELQGSGSSLRYQWIEGYTTVCQDFSNPPISMYGTNDPVIQISYTSAAPVSYIPYYCQVADACGNFFNSDTIILAMYAYPDQSMVYTYLVDTLGGTTLTITSPIAYNPVYHWEKGSFVLFDNSKFSGTSTNQLTINNLGINDQGTYTCFAANTECDANGFYPYVNYIVTLSNVGISENAYSGITISPNPGDNMITVTPDKPGSVSNLFITDIMGSEVMCPVNNGNNGSSIIDISTLTPGIYFLNGENNNQHFCTRFIKL